MIYECSKFKVTLLDGGRVFLDGGAMFGVVPHPLWSRQRKPDERNRIELAMNCLLIEDGKRKILVDTGAGDKWDEKSLDIYGLENRSPESLLAPVGLKPEQIDLVILSHLHFDHAGGNTIQKGDQYLPAFPNARYLMQTGEYTFAQEDNERVRASYLKENMNPLADETDRIEWLDGNTSIFSWLSVELVPGHTPFMQMILLEDAGLKLAFPADLVPTASHVPYPWIMGYDLEPLKTLATKKHVFKRALEENWQIVFEHDAELPVGTLVEDGRRLRAVPTTIQELKG